MCESYHSQECGPTPWTGIAHAGVFFIDVERRCIVAATSPARYCALSYCWGDISQHDFLKLTTSNKVELSKENGLRAEHPLLPLTIRDAIVFTSAIGCRYLWVDALCLLQDSEEEKQAQINRMDEIYAHAMLTIVAAAGIDAWEGLPGVRRDSRTVRHSERQMSGIKLSLRTPHQYRRWAIRQSGWYKRAWTLQEHVLSGRLLFFTPLRVVLGMRPYHVGRRVRIREYESTRVREYESTRVRELFLPKYGNRRPQSFTARTQ